METYMTRRDIAEVFPPGEFIKDELEARGWSQVDLVEITGLDAPYVSRIIKGNRPISPEIAKALGYAFGTSAQFWLNLESAYQLSKIETVSDDIARKAKLYETFPVREMLKRGWIEGSENIDVLEKRFLDFLGVKSFDEQPAFAHAAKKSTSYKELTPAQWSWLCRARQLAHAVHAEKFSDKAFAKAVDNLRNLLPNSEDVRKVPRILAEAGIRFIVIEPLPNIKIDGVCFWLNKLSPVIAITLRFDRIDWFWHTLMHELDHVRHREGMETPIVDTEIVGDDVTVFDDLPENEKRANKFAAEFLVAKAELDKFIARVSPLFSKHRIELFARRIKVHPGIIVGQLHFRKVFDYKYNRSLLSRVRDILISSALTDGYGNAPIL